MQPWISGSGGGLAASEPGFSSHWYPCKSLVVAGRAAGQSCSHAPVKVLPYLGTLVGTSESLNKGVIVVIIGRSDVNCM